MFRLWATASILAFALDLWLGDPPWLPHPVVALGAWIRRLERLLYHRPGPGNVTRGILLLLGTAVPTMAVVALLLKAAAQYGHWTELVVTTLLLWVAYATHSLIAHGERVRRPLTVGNLLAARRALARMVSRDTDHLEASAIARACIESLAENLTDGCLSPFLFGLVGGPIAAWGLKAVSTLDSMVGYRNRRYLNFGWASARCDDALHYLPARTLFLILPLASVLTGFNPGECWRGMRREGQKHDSPNAGIPEAGFAAALGLELGGPSRYAGVDSVKPLLNPGAPAPQTSDIRRAQRLVLVASALPLLIALPVAIR